MPPLQRRRRTRRCECTRARPRLGLLEVTTMRAFDMTANFQVNRWSGYLTRHRASYACVSASCLVAKVHTCLLFPKKKSRFSVSSAYNA